MAKIPSQEAVAQPVDTQQETLTQILERLNALEAENTALKNGNKYEKAKEHYK